VFIPLRTEIESRRPPLVTPLLMFANAMALLVILGGERLGELDPARVLRTFALHREGFRWWQPITYQFLHDLQSIWHLLFNMLFLWVFGCAVEERLGRPGFLLFYLGGGVLAGLAHLLTTPNPVIGASGSVAACSGAFLALFPRAHIKVLFFFLLIGIVQVPAALFIGLYIAFNLIMQFSTVLGASEDRVAYVAHLAGYAYGFGLCFLMLAARILPRKDVDAWFLVTQARRRRAMRQAIAEVQRRQPSIARERDARGGSPNERSELGAPPPPRRDPSPGGPPAKSPASTTEAPASTRDGFLLSDPEQERVARESEPDAARQARRIIDAAFQRLDVATAAEGYASLTALVPFALLPETRQLDVANQFLADGRNEQAALAYERFLAGYPNSERADDARLLLATIWTRRIPQPAKARPLLEFLRPRLRDERHMALADQLLRELPA